jgi:hypothetical protein
MMSSRMRYVWQDSNKVAVKEMEWEGMDEVHLAQDRLQWWAGVNMLMNLQVLSFLPTNHIL